MNLSYNFSHTGDFEIKYTTFFGLEEVLAKEVQQLGGRDVTVFTRGVSAMGDLGFLYKSNLCLHTALKVLIPITRFTADTEQMLYDNIKLISWEDFIDNSD